MSLLLTSQLKLNQSSLEKFKKKSNTASTGLLTERTLRSQRTLVQQKPKKLPYTIKRRLFTKNQLKKELNQTNVSRQRPQSPMNHCIYSSLDSKQQSSLNNYFSFGMSDSIHNSRCKTEEEQNLTNKFSLPIQSKSSSDKNKFMNSMIRSYGLATFKSTHNLSNNHMILINLGLIKQFYMIEAVDGFECANHVKKNISFLILKEYLNQVQKSYGKNKLKSLENAVYKAFSLLQTQILHIQKEKHENSGCFVNAILVVQNHTFTINCGMASSIIFTKEFKVMNGSQPHSTSNENEIKRITKAGIQFYQTEFNVKYKEKLSLKGPLRLYPSGSMFTRVMGKSFDKMAESKNVRTNPEQRERQIGLMSQPEMSYIECVNVQFVLIASSGLEEFMKKTLISSIVLHEVMKYSLTFTIHDLARECAYQILYQAYLRGYKNTASVIIVFMGLNVDEIKKKQEQAKQKQTQRQKRMEYKSPLRYVGNKKSFCKYQQF